MKTTRHAAMTLLASYDRKRATLRRAALGGLCGVALLLSALPAVAAPPTLTAIYPAGVQRGGSTTATVTGSWDKWPPQFWCDRPGVTITAEKEAGQVRIAATAEAIPGPAWVRVHDAAGASPLAPIVIGVLPEIVEVEPNDSPADAQRVDSRVVVHGRLTKANNVDSFRVKLARGETLVAALEANRLLGSPIDAVLQVCELRERLVSAASPPHLEAFVLEQNHDAAGLDPLVVCTAPRDGDYLVRLFAYVSVPNSSISFAGDDANRYRLTITTGPFVRQALPLAAPRKSASEVRLLGWNLPDDLATATLPAASSPAELFATAFHPEAAGAIPLPRSEFPLILAQAKRSLDDPQSLPVPALVSGVIEAPRGAAVFRCAARKGTALRIKVEAHSLGSPLVPDLAIVDPTGKQVALAQGARSERDFEYAFNPPADGEYRLVLRDLASTGSPHSVYRLTVAPVLPDFSLALAADRFVLTEGKDVEIPITIERVGGFDEAIRIEALDLPDGLVAEPVVSEPKGDAAKSVKLILKHEAGRQELASGVLRIVGRSTGSAELIRPATFAVPSPLFGRSTDAWATAAP